MAMRRYMAIHTFHSEETKKAMMKWAAENKATQREFMAGQVFDKCRTLATWLGNDDFFFVNGLRKVRKTSTPCLEKMAGINWYLRFLADERAFPFSALQATENA